jgi:diaminohydroxyphosphoribosylaminopyrimidine deaminase/5-amino-6-(5-phosphoribosylamino)uracil reductase
MFRTLPFRIFVEMDIEEKYMQRCLDLASLGGAAVFPNPMVGCVVVAQGKIIGEGYHKKHGESHAEVIAIEQVQDKELLNGATLYVSLEPCFHHGKTPPCVDLILRSGISRVVIGCMDPNPKVAGKSIQKLQTMGREVISGVLEQEARELNKRFFTYQLKQRPYVVLKWAQSKDGFMDRNREKEDLGIHWISQPSTQALVHTWRAQEHAILIGRRTAAIDNPSLTVRAISGKNPIRVVIDSQLQLENQNSLFLGPEETIIVNKKKSAVEKHVTYLKLPDINVKSILNALYQQNISSVLIEGGSRTLHYFIFEHLWDEARVIVGTDYLHDGLKAPVLPVAPSHSYSFGKDTITEYKRL